MTEPQPSPQPAPHEGPSEQSRWQPGFWSLIVTQFQGAMSDNAVKFLVMSLIVIQIKDPAEHGLFVTLIGLLFSAPFILFSMTGGWMADRFSKRTVTIGTKIFEVGVMTVLILGLMSGNRAIQLASVFLISTQAAFFGPSKYGLLPELAPVTKLSWANGVIEMGTFLAIIAGTVFGPWLAKHYQTQLAIAGFILLGCTVFGLIFSFGITHVPARATLKKWNWNFLSEVWEQLKIIWPDSFLLHAIVGNTYFFFLAALLQQNVFVYGSDVLNLDPDKTALLMASIAIGIGLGSLTAGFLSGKKIELGLIPIGAIGMSVFGFMLAIPGLHYYSVMGLLAALGFTAGFFIVPVMALIQHRPEAGKKGGVIAAGNWLSFGGVALAAGVYHLMTADVVVKGTRIWHGALQPGSVFFVCGLFCLFSTYYVVKLLPMAIVRFMLLIATNTIYRIRVVGEENIPDKGGALMVSNHLSFVDAMLLGSATDRNVRFMMFQDIYDAPFVKPIAKILKAIPISSNLRPRDMINSLRTASDAIRAGRIVCIFAEGQITRIGHLLPFRRGMERIMKDVEAPIIPVHLDGVWGSVFSFERGKFFWKIPLRIPFEVTVSFGKPMPATSSASEVRRAVQQLETDAYPYQRARMETLNRSFVRTARKHPWRFFMADGRTPKVTFFDALTKSIYLARRLRHEWKGQKMVGILLPPSVGGALVNIAAVMLGKVPVNFNYTASNEVTDSCAKQCEVITTVTSKAFLEKLPNLVPPGRVLFLEDLAADPSISEKLAAFIIAVAFPFEALDQAIGCDHAPKLDDLATVIFSSGSTGDPKGVMLTHYNIASNIDQVGRTFALDKHDRLMCILPFFHSFGFTVTLWLPATLGIGAVFHPNPLDAATIGIFTRTYACTLLVATPTFLQAYIRKVNAEDFGSLQYVIVGAEKLNERVAIAFEDKFGVRPLEGYGCTECAPVVSVNTKDYRGAGFRQVGFKRGKIGHPLPGISVRIVHIETGALQPVGESGVLQVSGPNVMAGYLGKPEKTAEVLRDGWYHTGDIAVMDEDGFLTITDRLSRFSKIGGEMVPHIKVEDTLHECAQVSEQIFAVTGIPDGKKGERLIVLHTLAEEKLRVVLNAFSGSTLPALWKPKAAQFVKVESIPYLGTGKLDLRKLKELALQMAESETA